MRTGGKAPGLAIGVALVSLAAQAPAFDLLIDPQFGSTENTSSTAKLTFDFSEHGDEDLLRILIENTTSPKIGSKLTAVGLELPDWLIQPPSLVLGVNGSYFDTLTFNDSVSPGWLDAPGGYDLMITGDGSFLGGNPNGAPTSGTRESILLSLGDTGLTPDQLDMRFHDFYTELDGRSAIGRFQAVGPDGERSDKVGGGVPEPASVILLALGAIALLRPRRTPR
jgi:hypothetical protein